MSNPSRLSSCIQLTLHTPTDKDDGNRNPENWRLSARYIFGAPEQDKRGAVASVETNQQSTTPASPTNMNANPVEVASPAPPPPSQPRDITPELPIASSRSLTPIELAADLDLPSSEDPGVLSSPVLSSIASDIDDASQLSNGTTTPQDTQDPFLAGISWLLVYVRKFDTNSFGRCIWCTPKPQS